MIYYQTVIALIMLLTGQFIKQPREERYQWLCDIIQKLDLGFGFTNILFAVPSFRDYLNKYFLLWVDFILASISLIVSSTNAAHYYLTNEVLLGMDILLAILSFIILLITWDHVMK
ncbi:unnamed protein product [Adineta steineri]|uniref:Uncharacterized protein n=1 Tax=Adineta steineri TaxID=433720 RepID=A0A814H0T4_9BILA|nr:unnamed protein product [Adineta steineri]CAF3798400.1 unnamed protein product [Adineta steineri]